MAASALTQGDHYFEADGVKFHYLLRGSGPLMVVQSVGWGMSGDFLWETAGPYLEAKNTVIYLEPRGNGKSSKPEDPSTMTAKVMADDLEHLRKHLALDSFPALFGGSHSAAIVLRYAEQYPSRVSKLILVDAQIMDSPNTTNTQEYIAKRKDDPAYAPAVAKLLELFGGNLPTTDEGFGEAMNVLMPWYFSDTTKADDVRKAMANGPPPSIWAFQTNVNDSKPENKIPHIADGGKVEAKTLILWGGEDAMCSLTAANAIAEAIKGSKLVVLPGVGHMPWLEAADQFWGEVNGFLAS